MLHVQVRRFKCLNPQCPRMTFVEPIEALAPAKQRRTVGFSVASCAIAQALGGSAAARLSVKLGMPTSRDTFLRALVERSKNANRIGTWPIYETPSFLISRAWRLASLLACNR
jgi:hypothetical protein